MYYPIFLQMKKTLGQMDSWLVAASTFAKERSFDATQFFEFRLAPDQFGFVRQVRGTCDVAKLAAARLTGKEAPVHADNEATVEELRARIRATVAFLDGLTAKDFEGAATRTIALPRWEGKVMPGADYFLEHGLPNFYFHASHAYAILRSAGVPLGKKDFLGALSLRAP